MHTGEEFQCRREAAAAAAAAAIGFEFEKKGEGGEEMCGRKQSAADTEHRQ
jgi:hypothetical protein